VIRDLLQPWKNLPRTIGLYALASVCGAVVLTIAHVASAQVIPFFGHLPMVPYPQGTGSGPPGSCSNSLDFSQACNSQYIAVRR
jgi:hypothetical protein